MTVSSPGPPREVLSFREGAEYLGVSERTLWANLDKIPHFRVGKQIRFHLADLREWITKQSEK